MHYAQVVFQAEQMGCDQETAKKFARKVITTAALLAMMPEDVLQVWCENNGNEVPASNSVPSRDRARVINALSSLSAEKITEPVLVH